MSDKLLNYFNGDSFAASTWQNKYALKDNEGNPIEETPEDMHHRLAREFARIENTYNDDDKLTEEEIFELFKDAHIALKCALDVFFGKQNERK